MSTRTARILGWVGLAVTLAVASPAAAQQWRIYLLGKLDPIVASFYLEDAPWVLFRDDESLYVFSVGCDRVERVERDGVALPRPACPVERLPTMTPAIYGVIVELEARRFEELVARLRDQTRVYNEAIEGAARAAGLAGRPEVPPGAARLTQRQLLTTANFALQQINATVAELGLVDSRIERLLAAAKVYPPPVKPRFFFAPR